MEQAPADPKNAFPSPVYRDTVLAQVFADAKRYFLRPLIEIDYAHTLMLCRQGIVSLSDAAQCLRALDGLDLAAIEAMPYDGSFEDLFFLIQREIALACGAEAGGRMHTARSRNDIDLTMYRMVLRSLIIETLTELHAFRSCLIDLAWKHRASLCPAYTHNQPAQPTTVGHYLMGMIEVLERDSERLIAAYGRVNRSPLGACAITTTGFPIDRECTRVLLGFDGLQVNSYGAIAAVDYLTESCSSLAVLMLNLGRFAQDLLLWSTAELGFLRLSDGYVQVSSIMPQKRNPVAIEHVRILASRAFTQGQSILGCLHNTPFADMNDAEDDLQPLAYTAFGDADRALRLLTGILNEAELNVEAMALAADRNHLAATELADLLVRSTGISFHEAHRIVSSAVKQAGGNAGPDAMVARIEHALAAHPALARISPDEIRKSLMAANFVAVRRVPGGPAPEVLDSEILRSRERSAECKQWIAQAKQRLEQAHLALHAQSDNLVQH